MREATAYAFDVGSPKTGLAWARVSMTGPGSAHGGTDLDVAIDAVAQDLSAGRSIALGFEAPLFFPVGSDYRDLCLARTGERDRPWSAGAGAYVSAVAVPVIAWILRAIRDRGERRDVELARDYEAWADASAQSLLLWEAFVSGEGHARTTNDHGMSEHIQDAATAACAFRAWFETKPRPGSAVTADPCISTVGAAALWSGWSTDLALLREPSLVLWPRHRLGEDVRQWVASELRP